MDFNGGRMLPDPHFISRRGVEWDEFAKLVYEHIESYTVPQYGDAPDDQASRFTEHDIAVNMQRYVNRLESNQRGPEEAQRDLLKIAHYCAILFYKRGLRYNKDGL
jgi:hypothetical protein